MKLLLCLISLIALILNTTNATQTLTLTGYYNVNQTTDANLYYLFYESQNSPATDPLIIWLSGGPGCSSLMAAFFENGPFSVSEDLSLIPNVYSWNTIANVLYIDSPVGSGFSYVGNDDGYSHTEEQVSENLYSLLTQFYAQYPKYSKLPLYVIGESYAGHYVPSFSYYIYQQNKDSNNINVNLKGLAVGNAMVDPSVQYGSLGPYAYSHGMIDTNALKQTEGLYESCKEAIAMGPSNYNNTNTICNEIMSIISEYAGNFNPYDVTQTCSPDLPLCYNFTSIQNYLQQPSVQKSMNVIPGSTWNLCSTIAYQEIIHDWFNTPVGYIPTLLENYKVLVYNGNDGWICNFLGSEQWVKELDWKYNAEFNNAPRSILYTGETIAGYVQSYDNLAMAVVNNAGHMCPHDQPAAALNLINDFIKGSYSSDSN